MFQVHSFLPICFLFFLQNFDFDFGQFRIRIRKQVPIESKPNENFHFFAKKRQKRKKLFWTEKSFDVVRIANWSNVGSTVVEPIRWEL